MTTPSTQPGKVVCSEEEWRKLLSPQQFHVLRQKGTERVFTGEYTDKEDPGTYLCAACGAELFDAKHKFHSGCGWPSFYTAAAGDRVKLVRDASPGWCGRKCCARGAIRTWGMCSTMRRISRPGSAIASTRCR